MVKRVLVPTSALMWGLQMAFLSPALALILVNLYGATTAEVGWVLSIYNASGFVASLVLPAYADRKGEYLRPMLVLRRADRPAGPRAGDGDHRCRWRRSPWW